MNFDYTQGDPRVSSGVNGATTVFKGGQPVMDQGLENVILFSVLSGMYWFANAFITNKNSQIESRFERAHRQAITLTVINTDIPDAGAKDLDWMIAAGIMSSIDIVTTNPRSNTVNTVFTFHPPGSDAFTLEASIHGKNWIAQFKYPAHERL